MSGADPSTAPWTISRLLNWTREHFAKCGVESPRLAAELLLAEAMGWPRIQLYTHGDREPDATQLGKFREFVRRAALHEPVAYLLGRREFFSLEFEVSREVLIPRPETETLVTRALMHIEPRKAEAITMLDMGTGSGCIAISLLTRLPQAKAVATDISSAALAIAQRNALRHQVVERIEFAEADGVGLPEALIPQGGFDLLVCNPPYIAEEEMKSLPQNVVQYEPHGALTDHADGLSLYRQIGSAMDRLMAPWGAVFVEIADGRRERVQQAMEGAGQVRFLGAWRGIGEPMDRVLGFTRNCSTAVQPDEAAA